VDYAKLLEMESFFICHIFLQFSKTQNLPSKIWQTVGDVWDEVMLEKGFSVFGKKKNKDNLEWGTDWVAESLLLVEKCHGQIPAQFKYTMKLCL
jgi:hypothetical protein